MTEAKQPKYEIIPRDFKGEEIEFFKKDGKVWIPSYAIAKGLKIQTKNLWYLFDKNKALLEGHTAILQIKMHDRRREVRIFDKTGFIWMAVKSNSTKALPFQEWVLNVIDEIVVKGYYIEKPAKIGSTDWALQTLEVMRSVVLTQQKQERIQIEQEKRLNELEEKDRYIFVTPRTKRKLQDEVHRVALEYFNGAHNKVWNPLKAHYQVSRYEEFKEEDAQKILTGLAREHPPKNKEV